GKACDIRGADAGAGGILLVETAAVADDGAAIGIVGEGFADAVKRTRLQEVVAAEPVENRARAPRETLVDGVGLAAVAFAHPAREPRPVFADDGNGIVGAAAVDDVVFEIRISLQQD